MFPCIKPGVSDDRVVGGAGELRGHPREDHGWYPGYLLPDQE